jgi:cell filamentation protein, protein adenylyltransferase
LEAAIASIGKADALAKTYPNHFLLSRVLVRQEAVTSSAIEGTCSTLDQLLEVEESDDGADAESRQVRSYASALERALSQIERNRYDGFSVGLIRDLQREVVKDDPDYAYEPGKIREHVVWISGDKQHIAQSIYNPTPPADIGICVAQHIDYLRCIGLQQLTQSLVVRIAVAHAHFEAIHPFPNGNGRTGRLLLPLMMAADGHTPLYLAPYIAVNRPAYMDGLRAAQQRLEYAPLIEVLSRAIVATVDMAEEAHNDLFRLYVDWTNRQAWRKNSTARRALDLLVGFPVVTIKRLASELGVSAQAASVAAHQLVEAKVLTEKTGHRRNRVFVASEVLKVYNRSFSDEPTQPVE